MSNRLSCDQCAVRNSALCRALPTQALARMNRMAVRRRISAGQVISTAPPDQQGVATIIAGVVKLVSALADGRQQIVALQFSGDFIGDPFATSSVVTAEAATPVELCQLTREDFRALIDENPGMQQLLVQHTFADLQSAREWMLLLGRKTAGERVASLFLLLAQRTAGSACEAAATGPVRFVLPISRSDIADFLGITIETVSRQIHRLKEDRVLTFQTHRDVTVPDMAALRRAAEREDA